MKRNLHNFFSGVLAVVTVAVIFSLVVGFLSIMVSIIIMSFQKGYHLQGGLVLVLLVGLIAGVGYFLTEDYEDKPPPRYPDDKG